MSQLLKPKIRPLFLILSGLLILFSAGFAYLQTQAPFDQASQDHARNLFEEGRQIFRYDTFGDEAFWGGQLQLHEAIQGRKFGGVGPGVSPATALSVGLKVDVDALPKDLIRQLSEGEVDLDDQPSRWPC
jgi:hypothetical protein